MFRPVQRSNRTRTTAPKFEPHPAFRNPSGDVILVSKDDVEFRVHKLFLSEASNFFRNMFEHPQPPAADAGNDTVDAPPARIPWDENAADIDTLLRYIYPVAEKPAFGNKNFDGEWQLLNLLTIARKWQIDCAVTMLTRELLTPRRMQSSWAAMRIYLFACLHGFDEIKEGALHSASRMDPLHPMMRGRLDGVDGRDLGRLADLKEKREYAIEAVLGQHLTVDPRDCHHANKTKVLYNLALYRNALRKALEIESSPAAFGSVTLTLDLLSFPHDKSSYSHVCDVCFSDFQTSINLVHALIDQVTLSKEATVEYQEAAEEYFESLNTMDE